MNEIILEISAFGIALFCFVDCIKNRSELYLPFPKGPGARFKSQHYSYLCLIFTLIVSALSSVLEVGMENYVSYKSVFVLYFLNEVYFIFHSAVALFFALYIINLTGVSHERSRLYYAVFCAPFFLCEILIILNPLTKLIFYIDENFSYCRGSYIWLLYVVGFAYALYGIAFFLVRMKLISKLDRFATFVLILIASIGIVVQAVFAINVELFFESIAFLGFMLLLEDERFREKTGRRGRMSRSFILVIALIFFTVVIMNISLIFNAGTDQTERIGEIQVSSLRGELQQAISESESNLLRYSMGLEQLINENAGTGEIEEFIKDRNTYYSDLSGGNCFNTYAASPLWTIIPGFEMPEEYHAVERVWYIGALDHPGQVYISAPYIDAETGDLCYTFSCVLSDNKTVAAMDYTLSRVQDLVERMGSGDDQFAMIVTEDGTIVGCTTVGLQGSQITDVLPLYADVYERVNASREHKSFDTTVGGNRVVIFSSETVNGWKLILSVDHSKFYADTYRRMVLLVAIDLLMVAVIIVFYMVSVVNQERAQNTLASTESFIAALSGELSEPLNEIIRIGNVLSGTSSDHPEARQSLIEAGRRLQEKMNNLFSYSNIVRSGGMEVSEDTKRHGPLSTSGKNVRKGITAILIAALLIGLIMCIGVTYGWGTTRISKEAVSYNSEVTQWMQQKQGILSMFADVIAADPEVLADYDKAVKWLDDIAKQYSEMTFAYMANPYSKEHTVIMNNGWVPYEGFDLENRPWYVGTTRSGTGYSISEPYFDAQTGLYCITFSRSVYSTDGRYLGVFGIDCLLDKLIDILDDSYSANSYAFMVDQNGTIINHPFKEYEISPDNSVNIADTEYADVYQKGSVFWMRDHDGRIVASYAEKNALSGFTVIVVQRWWGIYGAVLIVAVVFIIMIIVSIIGMAQMINRFTRWQDEVNEKLVEAVDNAVSAEKAKSRFLAQMSHEIRTPINTVLGMNEMILREASDDEIRDYAGNIKSAGRNLLGLINTILDFSKIEEGKMEIVPVRYDTATVIENVINSVQKRAADKGLLFEAHVDTNLPSAMFGDDMRITQVVMNLLTNAVKYTQEGRIDLFVDGSRKDDDTVSLAIKVKDTGIGIREEDIGKLFESFTRLEERRNRNIEGTGLGMAIVNRLLDMMGSKLEVTSVYGEGSEFSFTIDQRIIDAEPVGDYRKKAREAVGSGDEDTYPYAPEAKVLIVDDSSMNIKVMKSLMKLNGISPDTAFSGQEALEKMRDNKYDVIMLDHMMPQMDGIETLQKAKEENIVREGCHVVALTANAVVGARESYLEAGFDDYLSKPVEVAALEGMIAKYVPADKVEYRSRPAKKKAGRSGKDSNN